MARQPNVTEQTSDFWEERQRHVEAANAISETLDRINALVRGTSNGHVEKMPRGRGVCTPRKSYFCKIIGLQEKYRRSF